MTEERVLWDEVVKQYPNHWVIMYDPIFKNGDLRFPESGVLLCAEERRVNLQQHIPDGGLKRDTLRRHTMVVYYE